MDNEKKVLLSIQNLDVVFGHGKKAFKAGDAIDYDKAIDLIKKVFAMPMPRCPHGRPLYYQLTKDKLYQLLERTV